MRTLTLYLLIAAVVEIEGKALPYMQDVVLKPIGTQYSNQTQTINGTCAQCLCDVFSDATDHAALNCFPNNTCQVFPTYPVSYKLQSSAAAQLYFLQGIFPSASQCCMPNITEIVNLLKNTTPTVVQLSYTLGAIGYDEARPARAVAIGWDTGDLYWFNPWNMSSIKNQTINERSAIALQNSSIFTAIDFNKTVIVLNEQTLGGVTNITHPSFNRVRKFLFMNNSQTIMVTTQDNKSVTILDVISPTQITVRVRLYLKDFREQMGYVYSHFEGRTPFSIWKYSRRGEGQRLVLLCLVVGWKQCWILQLRERHLELQASGQ